jgi:tetratricopeptide (TPR) repeat protein
MGLGIAQDLQKHQTEAIRSLLRAINVDPENLSPYSFLAGLSGVSPETDTQIRNALAGLVVARPESAMAHYDYALALWKQRVISPGAATAAEIESQLRLALTKDPKMTRAHFLLGLLYADSGNYENAATELRQTVQADPGNAQAHYRLAQVYKRDRQDELAKKEIAEFMALHGNPASDENSPEADLRKLAPQLSRQMPEAKPCQRESR